MIKQRVVTEFGLLDIAGNPEECTCGCPDGAGQHLEGCHSYDDYYLAGRRFDLARDVRHLNALLSEVVSEAYRKKIMQRVAEIIKQTHEIGSEDAKLRGYGC